MSFRNSDGRPTAIPYELRVGVTGHRALADPEAVKLAVERCLDRIEFTFRQAAEHPGGPSAAPRGAMHFLVRWLVAPMQWFSAVLAVILPPFWWAWRQVAQRVAMPLVFFPFGPHTLKEIRGEGTTVADLWNSVVRVLRPKSLARIQSDSRELTFPMAPARAPADLLTPLKWVAVSPLARGADRILAKAVLDRPQARVKAVLPFRAADYIRDFDDRDDRNEFQQLLRLDPAPVELPGDYGDRFTAGSREQAEARNQGYLAAGRHVVDLCEILIAIWDGQPALGAGGTADIVAYAVSRGRTVIWIDVNAPGQPPRIITKDESRPAPAIDTPAMKTIPFPNTAAELSYGYYELVQYNVDPGVHAGRQREIVEHLARHLLESARKANLDESFLDPVVENLLPHYARADQLAIRYQGLYMSSSAWFHQFLALAVTVVVVQVLFFAPYLWIIWLEIMAMLLAAALLRISEGEGWQEKWLRYRHLAERLRTTMFMLFLGPGETQAGPTADNRAQEEEDEDRLPLYRGPETSFFHSFDPIVAAVRKTMRPADRLHETEFAALRNFLAVAWIADQAQYHAGNAEKRAVATDLARALGAVLFFATLAMAVMHFMGVGHASPHESPAGRGGGTGTLHAVSATAPDAPPAESPPPAEPAPAAPPSTPSGAPVPEPAAADSPSRHPPPVAHDPPAASGAASPPHETSAGDTHGGKSWIGLTITLLAIILPAWGAAVHAINALQENERIATLSQRMFEYLHGISLRAEHAATLDELREELREAEQVTAAENHEWLVSLSFRRPELTP